ncbi:hemolysin family protein [Xylocopilactobacillus apicola]|uniref:Hemolysin n=1 Tax=Xylocopilactobacillus apicola TaxID=2932184 RepID=A0AAU9DP14_9LACO|nr:hemolysin family protein [Xylocopilactobacillus apicola]BDR58857.1 hypothetical protein XA3_12980 [Xylocopilactobacillus apicola]
MSASSEAIIEQLILIVILTAINAVFSAAELAVVSVNKNKLESGPKDKKTKALLNIVEDSSDFLAIIQVGITFAGFLSSASAATGLAEYVQVIFGHAKWAHEASIILVTVLLSFFTLVFGELYPKQIAVRNTEGVARAFVLPISFVGQIFRPFVWLLSATTNVLLKMTGQYTKKESEVLTREEMINLIESGRQTGMLASDELSMMEGVFSLQTKMAREIMIPRTDTFMINVDDPAEDNVRKILNEVYSRVPVYKENRDEIVGIVTVRSLLKFGFDHDFEQLSIEKLMNQPYFVPETIRIDKLLDNMRNYQQQMAILLDEYGGVTGILTIEDLVEEIVGEINDEIDQADILCHKVDSNHYIVKGAMPLDDFNEFFKVNFADEEVDTIAGYVIKKLGKIPKNSQKLSILEDNLKITTGRVKGSRLLNLQVEKLAQTIKNKTEEN